MNNMLLIKKVHVQALIPSRAHEGDSALDLYCCGDFQIAPWGHMLIPTGVAIQLPDNTNGMVLPRGSTSKRGILVHTGTLDQNYRGEVFLFVTNLNHTVFTINHGDRIAQLVIHPIVRPLTALVNELHQSNRGANGFGSTGV